MSKRTKLEKFAENQRLENVFENFSYEDPTLFVNVLQKVDYKGKWKSDYFKNAKPLVLELACGRGEYSIGLAQMYPNQNYIGVAFQPVPCNTQLSYLRPFEKPHRD